MAEDLESLRGSFNRSLRVEGKAERTLVLYGQSITFFSAWLDERGRPADLSSLDRETVLQWLDYLRGRGLTTGTIRTRWRGLRRFVNWLLAEGIIRTDPLAGIVIDKPEPPPVPILTDDELTALLGACKGNSVRRPPRRGGHPVADRLRPTGIRDHWHRHRTSGPGRRSGDGHRQGVTCAASLFRRPHRTGTRPVSPRASRAPPCLERGVVPR